jgi:hypothetical protein
VHAHTDANGYPGGLAELLITHGFTVADMDLCRVIKHQFVVSALKEQIYSLFFVEGNIMLLLVQKSDHCISILLVTFLDKEVD